MPLVAAVSRCRELGPRTAEPAGERRRVLRDRAAWATRGGLCRFDQATTRGDGCCARLDDGTLAFNARHSVVGIGYWVAPDVQGKGSLRAVVLLSRWALHSGSALRVEALPDRATSHLGALLKRAGFSPRVSFACT
jgi:RimJ/RimL family protein N-acetyltransferase